MDQRFLQVATLIAARPPLPPSAGAAERMRRLCEAAAPALGALGVGVNVMAEGPVRGMFAASDAHSEQVEELQFTMGEGPCMEAFSRRRPVLVPDLDAAALARWPVYIPAVHTLGVRAIFAFPLQIGAARMGVLDVFRAEAGMLPDTELQLAFTFAEVATATLLGEEGDGTGPDLLGTRAEVFQAQGMLKAQLGISLSDAMARMRAYAFAHDLRLTDVAAGIIAGTLRLEPQP